jgi:tetratricopeptide (TPR) repeat protein
MPRSPGRLFAALAAISIAAGALWWSARPGAPKPFELAALGSMDPEVHALLAELRAAVRDDPRNPTAWERLAMACEANGFVGAARDAHAVAAQLAPDDPRATYRLALVESRLGHHDAALAALGRTNELAPEYAPAWSRRGVWLLDRGDDRGAQAAFERSLALAPDDLSASLGMARVHLARREHERAASVLERVLEQHPGDRYALQLLGTAYRRLGRVDDAEFALAVGAEGEPTWHDPWSEEVGQYRRGFATELKSATADAMAGRFDAALPRLEKLRRGRPDDIALANHTAEVLTAAGRPQDAIAMLAPIAQHDGVNADTHIVLASAYFAAGNLAAADGHAARAIALHASGARAFEIRGLVAWRSGRAKDAASFFEQGRARDPRDGRLPAWIGVIALEQGRATDAAALFSEVLRKHPLQPDALAGLAMAQDTLGEHEQAALALARAEQVAPGHPRVQEARARLERASHPQPKW